MRILAVTLPLAALATACAVPDVTFVAPDAALADGGPALEGGADAGGDVGEPVPIEASSDGDPDDARVDASEPMDAPYDGPLYCTGPGSMMPPMGGKCCPMNGGPCYGDCNMMGCAACGPCASPRVCCTNGPMGVCQMPPCSAM